jgi:hypothetical protein
MEIGQALHHLGEITGEITTYDLIENLAVLREVFSQSFVVGSKPYVH